MSDPKASYARKTVSAADAARSLLDQSNLVLGMGVAMPPAFMDALASRVRNEDSLSRLNLYYMHGSAAATESILSEDLMKVLKLHVLFMSSHDRALDKIGRAKGETYIHFIPCLFHQVGRLLTEQIDPDCLVVTVSPMDRSGHFSLGTNADYSATVMRKAKRVIVEVNAHMPRTFGQTLLHIDQVDAVIEHDALLMEVPSAKASPEDEAIAQRISEEIPDRSTIQMGVGGIPAAVVSNLGNRQDLGLHSELISPPIVRLIRQGVITGAAKAVMPHQHIFTLALGDREMYDFMDDIPSIVGLPAAWVNSPAVIRKNNQMVSVNGAIEIDLTGQINSESVNGQQFSGTGGQLDFVRGAYLAEGGKSFIALRSTAKGGTISRVVASLNNAAVTDPRMDTHFVVTEYGMVNLKGLSLQERAKAMIGLAHPKFREDLERSLHGAG